MCVRHPQHVRDTSCVLLSLARAAREYARPRAQHTNMADRSRPYVGESADVVAAAELRNVKPGSRVYERRTPNIFFLSTREKVLANVEKRIEEAQAKTEEEQQPDPADS